MPRSKVESIVKGGKNLLDPEDRFEVDKEILEAQEPLNLRTADPLDNALGQVLRRSPGGYLTNPMYRLDVPGNSYPQDMEFDRCYWELNLLVDFFSAPMNEWDKTDQAKEIAEKHEYCKTLGRKYLPIQGQASLEQIAEAVK
jgi:hypothetical protein